MGQTGTTMVDEQVRIGEVAPDFEVGAGVRLTDFRGEPVVLAFYPEEWDPARPQQLAQYREAIRKISGDAQVVGVTTDGFWCELETNEEESVRFPLIYDLEAASLYGVAGRQAVFVLDADGIVRWSHIGSPGESPNLDELTSSVARVNWASFSRRRLLVTATAASLAFILLPRISKAVSPAKRTLERTITLDVNGKPTRVAIEPRVTLLDALRDRMGMTGTKKGCDHGQCGACTVHMDGRRVNSCLVLAMQAEGSKIETVEGLAQGDRLHPVQEAFIKNDGFQCGYCTPGQIMSAVACIREGHTGSDEEIKEWMSGNICRCGAYPGIVASVREAAGK